MQGIRHRRSLDEFYPAGSNNSTAIFGLIFAGVLLFSLISVFVPIRFLGRLAIYEFHLFRHLAGFVPLLLNADLRPA